MTVHAGIATLIILVLLHSPFGLVLIPRFFHVSTLPCELIYCHPGTEFRRFATKSLVQSAAPLRYTVFPFPYGQKGSLFAGASARGHCCENKSAQTHGVMGSSSTPNVPYSDPCRQVQCVLYRTSLWVCGSVAPLCPLLAASKIAYVTCAQAVAAGSGELNPILSDLKAALYEHTQRLRTMPASTLRPPREFPPERRRDATRAESQ